MYAGGAGDPVVATDSTALRGMFHRTAKFGFRDCLDGSANTLAMGEIATDDGTRKIIGQGWGNGTGTGITGLRDNPGLCYDKVDPNRPNYWRTGEPTVGPRGGRWTDYGTNWSVFNTVLPPNGPSCAHEVAYPNIGHSDQIGGVYTAASHHQGGAHVLLCDGAIRFISENVDAGNKAARSVYNGSSSPPGSESPYGTWGAMGSRNGSENKTL